ncbi:MAG: GNAT family N-acetyltransferase [Steroidobacteraceae bacterium]
MQLPAGYSDVAAGQLVSVVTCLEMRAPPAAAADPPGAVWQLRRVVRPSIEWYRDLFRRVGSEWLWFSRLQMAAPDLEAILWADGVEVFAATVDGADLGLLELDFRDPGNCELAFFGLTAELRGRGAGRWLMNRAIERAWSRPIERFWVHTCSNDHPQALAFYLRSGFRAYARQVEVADDPRLNGTAPRTAAPHVPIIEPAP